MPTASSTKTCNRCGKTKKLVNKAGSESFQRKGETYRQPCKVCCKDILENNPPIGKKCTRCAEWKLYYNEDGTTNFHKGNKDNFRQPCKVCRKGETFLGIDVRCKHCGTRLESKSNKKVCKDCVRKVRKWDKGSVYICMKDPTDGRPWEGGHLSWTDMHWMKLNGNGSKIEGMLPLGYCPEGMELELWKNQEFVGLFEVMGEQLAPQELYEITPDEYKPRGDRRYFT